MMVHSIKEQDDKEAEVEEGKLIPSLRSGHLRSHSTIHLDDQDHQLMNCTDSQCQI